ncbi:MAG: queuosine precursor transporter [Bacillota bacterium]|nr:queuosine precursor transporter [Bacillota bacterium]
MDARRLKIIVAMAAIYIALVIFSNLGSLRVLAVAGLSVDGGALLYPFTFTARDILHKKSGAALTRFVIILAAGVNLALFGFVWLVGVLPADMTVGAQGEYALVLAPGVRLVLASVLAMTAAELLDTRIYSAVRRRFGARRQWLRVLLSNLVSVPVDTLIFLALAFGGKYPLAVLGSMFAANIAIKFTVSLLSLAGVYAVKDDID